MIVGIRKVSKVDWCLTSRIAGLVLPVGRFSIPVTRTLIPSRTRAPSICHPSQRAAIQNICSPLLQSEAVTM